VSAIELVDTLNNIYEAKMLLDQSSDAGAMEEGADVKVNQQYQSLQCGLTPVEKGGNEWEVRSDLSIVRRTALLTCIGVCCGAGGANVHNEHTLEGARAPWQDYTRRPLP
jgi:hypothetical protein